MAFKHLHLTAIALSLLFLILQVATHLMDSKMKEAKWLKVLPHIINTVLIITAIGLCVTLAQYPFVHDWVTSKLIGLVAYVLLAVVAVKWARTNAMRVFALIGAVAWLGLTGKIAITKTALF
ncbi:MAG: SirB2 family protein [Glaciecola sp.]